jgi:acyl carrier protein
MTNKQLYKIIAEILETEINNITPETSRDEMEKWDSLAMLQIVGEIQDELSVKIPIEEIANIMRVKDFLKFLK